MLRVAGLKVRSGMWDYRWLGGVMALVVWIYWPGLHGPFVYDDQFNLNPVILWSQGLGSALEILFANTSGLFGRPLSMLSFLITGIFGAEPFHFKLGNLILHLACGVLVWRVLKVLLELDARLAGNAPSLALIGASLWLAHPLNVSTVLYPVQRMTQMSTLFGLGAVLAFVSARSRMARGEWKDGFLMLYVGLPVLVLLGVLGKENAAVMPLVCLFIWLGLPPLWKSERKVFGPFFLLTVALPTLVVGLSLAWDSGALLGGYEARDFTVWQRLLTECRVLVEYVAQILVPRGNLMGVFSDGYKASTGLLKPVSTLVSMALLVLISGAAVALRSRAPLVFVGWFFFLAAHSIEASVLPLDFYYDHRNYFPSVGLLLAILALGGEAWNALDGWRGLRRWGAVGLVVVSFAAMLMTTTNVVRTWRDIDSVLGAALVNQPASLRARISHALRAHDLGNTRDSILILEQLQGSTEQRWRHVSRMFLLGMRCLAGENVAASLATLTSDAPLKLDMDDVQAVSFVLAASQRDRCAGLDDATLGKALAAVADAASDQSDEVYQKRQVRYAAALVLARSEHWDLVLPQARLAWQSGAPLEVGALLARAYVAAGRADSAEAVVTQMREQLRASDRSGALQLETINQLLQEHRWERRSSQQPSGH